MFLIAPLFVLIVSLGGFFVIVSRKFIYLKKLEPQILEESAMADGGFWHAFFEELLEYPRQIQVREQAMRFLAELEKALRKLRLLALKIERATNSLVLFIQSRLRNYQEKERASQAARLQEEADQQKPEESIQILHETIRQEGISSIGMNIETDQKYLREEEQRLIMSIAKSPRNAQLYKELGLLYVQTGELDDARQSFEKALELDPGDYMIKTKLARVLRKINLPE